MNEKSIMTKSIVIYGFGRMGLTHYAILNQLMDNIDVTIVDLDKKVNFIAKKNVNAKIEAENNNLKQAFDIAVICTPPMYHISTINACLKRGDKTIFVEKPFGGVKDDYSFVEEHAERVKVGFVMRFLPVINWLKQNLVVEDIVKFKGSYFSNSIEKKPKGWRNGNYSGVCNEMGSHIIDLSVYLLGIKEFQISNKEIKSVVSDTDDIVSFNLKTNNILCDFHFDWVDKNYRKPVFNLEIILKDGNYYKVDQQKVELYDKDGKLLNKITAVDFAATVPYYLRGVEFTRQMQDMISKQETLTSVEEALITRRIIKNILG